MNPPFRTQTNTAQQRGMALVVTLALLVLVTIATMAFFSRATATRVTESSRSNLILADQIAATGANHALSEFLADIVSGSNSTLTSGKYYVPNSPERMLPGISISSSISSNATDFAALTRQSLGGDSTGDPSQNGRTITAEAWNLPHLLGGTGFASTDQLPTWIYLSKNGTTSSSAIQGETIGRFAFNAYDVGGLLDINVSGHGGNLSDLLKKAKGGPFAADLSAILSPSSQADGATSWPPTWRLTGPWAGFNPGTDGFDHYATQGWRQPFFKDGSSDRMFASRQDLIRYAKRYASTFGGVDRPALQYLTTFSRSLPEPSLPAVDATTLGFPLADHFAATYNGAFEFTGYRDDGTKYSYEIKAGSPVLHKKFSLAKIARTTGNGTQSWLTPTGPATGISPAAIKAVFGLKWNSSAERWDYTSPDGTTMTDHIKSLSEVAALNRPPDFFEILKAGINPDSLGGSQNQTGANIFDNTQKLLQSSEDYQIFRIGASIIDNADGDNYPTRIAFDLAGEVEAAGVEDLPYLSSAFMRFAFQRAEILPANSNKWRFTNMKFLIVPLLFNPHREGDVLPPGMNPSDLRVEIQSGNVAEIGAVKGNSTYSDIPFMQSTTYPPADFPRAISTQSKTITSSHRIGISTLDGKGDIGIPASLTNSFVLTTLDNQNPFPTTGTFPLPQLNQRAVARLTDFSMVLTYKSPGGNYRVYDCLGGAATSAWSISTDKMTFGAPLSMAHTGQRGYTFQIYDQNIAAIGAAQLLKFDPRTTRYGLSYSYAQTGQNPNIKNNDTFLNPPSFTLTIPPEPNKFAVLAPTDVPDWGTYAIKPLPLADYFFPKPPLIGADRFTFGQLAQGGLNFLSSSGLLENIPDRPQDAGPPLVRPNFAFVFGSDSSTPSPANPLWWDNPDYSGYFQGRKAVPSDSDLRPMILQRPYQSVAELGHVFRDQPWKNVDFSHGSSPDLALLDLFALTEVEVPLAAGTINLNSARKEALTALFLEAGNQITANATAYNGTIDATGAASISDDVRTATTASPSRSNPEWVRTFLSQNGTASNVDSELTTSAGKTKADREILARALTGATQTRVWNLMVDVIAQAGTSPENGRFIVGGEARIWRSMAIDRLTGKILDTQTESVSQ